MTMQQPFASVGNLPGLSIPIKQDLVIAGGVQTMTKIRTKREMKLSIKRLRDYAVTVACKPGESETELAGFAFRSASAARHWHQWSRR